MSETAIRVEGLGKQVVEQGTHAQLLAMGKHYASLWQLQAAG